jgi:hypothetical protein
MADGALNGGHALGDLRPLERGAGGGGTAVILAVRLQDKLTVVPMSI